MNDLQRDEVAIIKALSNIYICLNARQIKATKKIQ